MHLGKQYNEKKSSKQRNTLHSYGWFVCEKAFMRMIYGRNSLSITLITCKRGKYYVQSTVIPEIYYIFAYNLKSRNMKELLEKVNESFKAFIEDANLQIEKGNKAAGTRARKSSLEIEKAMKEFRKISLDHSKQ